MADTQSRLKDATEMISELMATPDKGIPQELFEKARCVVVVPGMKKGAFVVGGEFGKGFAVCRNNSNTGWGAPAAIQVEGGSVGFQIGASATDVVMLVMNESGMRKLTKSKFTLGADASIAAGPVGRTASGKTDAYMNAEILSWSRSKGLFAGLSLSGATLRQDHSANKTLYGQELQNSDILMSNREVPTDAQPLIAALNRTSMHEQKSSADRTK